MKGDFTRATFDAQKHYSRVLFQQGRVTLDADPNEQTEILLHYLRTLARDLLGPHAGPAQNLGFAIAVQDNRVQIGAGRYYVDGILVEVDEPCFYDAQPHFALPPDDPLAGDNGNRLEGRTLRFYLDVWERHVTAIDDDRIRESALNGPDTATRSQVVWQVRALEVGADEGEDDNGNRVCSLDGLGLVTLSDVRLAARVDPGLRIEDPCITAPDARFRGAENQLYRVEIHRGGALGSATFKWSRDNGSVAARWLGKEGSELVVANARGFSAGCWLELTHEGLDLAGQPGPLVKLVKVEGDHLTIDEASHPQPAELAFSDTWRHPRVRRWDQVAKGDLVLKNGAVPVVAATATDPGWIDLEDGVQVRFEGGDGRVYRSGDYWQIPARVATGSIEWPSAPGAADEPAFQRPRGIEHHYAPLGFLSWNADGAFAQDCRCRLLPIDSCAQAQRPGEVREVPVPAERAPRPVARETGATRGPRARTPAAEEGDPT